MYGLLFNKVDDWLTRIRNLYGQVLSWKIFKEEFHREYLTECYKNEKVASFISLVQRPMIVREYVDKFEDFISVC